MEKKLHYRLRLKLLLTITVTTLVFLLVVFYLSFRENGNIISNQMDTYGKSITETLAVSVVEDMLSINYPVLQRKVQSIGEYNPEILNVEVYQQENLVAGYFSEEYEAEKNGENKIYRTPVNQYVKSTGETSNLGSVKVVLSGKKYASFLFRERARLFSFSLFLLGLNIALVYFSMRRLLLRPIEEIVRGTRIIGNGNLNYRFDVKNNDEMGLLEENINTMTANLQKYNVEIRKRTSELENSQINLFRTLREVEFSRKKTEEEKEKTGAIIANFVDPVIVIDNENKLTFFNPAAEKIFNLSKSDLGKTLMTKEQADCAEYPFCLNAFRKFFKSRYDFKVLKFDKKSRYPKIEEMVVYAEKLPTGVGWNSVDYQKIFFKVHTSPVITEKGEIYGHMKVFYDLTREKLIDKMKSEFISVAAHQMRTPLSAMKWSLSFLIHDEERVKRLDEQSLRFLSKAYEENEKIIKLVGDLLNVSQIEEGRFMREMKFSSVRNILKEVLDSLETAAQMRDVKLNYQENVGDHFETKIDAENIKLSFQNLISNAIKYSLPGGDVFVNIKEEKINEKDFILVSIKDRGIGISQDDQKKLFSKFFRSDNAIKLQTEGSGLGLFMVKNIIEAHQGEIWVESDLNEGATFYVRLPIKFAS